MALIVDKNNKKQFDAFKYCFRKNEVLGLILEDFEPLMSIKDMMAFFNAAKQYIETHSGDYRFAAHEEDGNKGLFLTKIR